MAWVSIWLDAGRKGSKGDRSRREARAPINDGVGAALEAVVALLLVVEGDGQV